MLRSLWIAKTGLDAQQMHIDVITNNLANVSTNGFKRSRAVFEDLLYQTLRQPGALPIGVQVIGRRFDDRHALRALRWDGRGQVEQAHARAGLRQQAVRQRQRRPVGTPGDAAHAPNLRFQSQQVAVGLGQEEVRRTRCRKRPWDWTRR